METDQIYPRLLRRVRAVLIDSGIAIVVMFSWWLTLPLLEGFHWSIKLAFPVTAWAIFDPILVSTTGGTPGHHIMGLKIVSARTKHRIDIVRALIRSVLRGVLGWMSFILVLITKKHQAIHDLILNTIVILKSPETVRSNERLTERSLDYNNFVYPSSFRRLFVIVIYFVLSTLAYAVGNVAVLSESCLSGSICSQFDSAISRGASVLWLLSLGAIVVYGWRSELFGARRKPISNGSADAP